MRKTKWLQIFFFCIMLLRTCNTISLFDWESLLNNKNQPYGFPPGWLYVIFPLIVFHQIEMHFYF